MCTVAVLSSVWLAATEGLGGLKPNGSDMGVALYSGVVPTALCRFLQTIGQRNIGRRDAREKRDPGGGVSVHILALEI
jgi:hypothetical protein